MKKSDLSEPRWGMIQQPFNGLTMIDLFCGAGVGASGFKLAGYKIVYAIDNQKYAVDTYNRNIGNHAVLGDIRKLKSEDVPWADIITGGFPCTPFSVAGKGNGVQDKNKGDLGYHFYRIIKEKQPKAFLMENVGGLLTKKHKKFFEELMKLFDEAGYHVTYQQKENGEPDTLNCWEYGVPQLRKRVIAVGIRKDLGKTFTFPSPIPEQSRTTIRDAIGDLPDPNGENNHKGYGIRKDEAPYVDKIPPGGNWRNLPVEDQIAFLGKAFYSGGGRTGFLRKVKFDNPAWTLTSFMNGKNNAQIVDNRDKYTSFPLSNHNDYYQGDFSPRYKSRNRQKQWDEPSFTIVSSARQLPLYPEPARYDIRKMDSYEIAPPRRFTVRECLRLQTVPDWFSFGEDVSLAHQYERCSGIPSLIAYRFGKQIAELLKEPA
ncbi:DNA (cytosine-5-)-methyltransferase (plasmid) [Aneurinibacillus sp. Ricciae_BoGa-3]|uniref:DNA cytosine methyltransferase n=1 Tax=Aneurinibacillus sp. Ricciae_BoGa-3 TaxID=3022697 RepID=UPI002342442C|nr:DNA (cytosine-5-)-methyltransferase [Aneurinibacillus sp. Ricciae_BoGa-3]WCK57708.1 DNA (cytosine-5-)-methyltransferase [Aneurinibacillus sp. Ricciae_BoGa-3]